MVVSLIPFINLALLVGVPLLLLAKGRKPFRNPSAF
jgi:hypothetical protein